MTLAQERDVWSEYQHATGVDRERIEEELVNLHKGIAYKLIHKYRYVDEAEGEAFLGLLKAIRNYDPSMGLKFSSFAYSVVRNQILMAYRKQKVEVGYYATSIDSPIKDGEGIRLIDTIASDDYRDYGEVMGLKQTVEAVKVALQNQPKRRLEVLEMRLSDHSYKEVSAALDMSLPLVNKNVSQLRAEVREFVRMYDSGELDIEAFRDVETKRHELAVQSLAGVQREYYLCHLSGMDFQEIADKHGTTYRAVQVGVSRARRKLHRMLEVGA